MPLPLGTMHHGKVTYKFIVAYLYTCIYKGVYMGFSVAQTYLSDILHTVSQALLAPDIILLLVFIGYALFSIGSVVVEYFTVRKHFNVVMPKFLAALTDAKEEDIPRVIEESGLLNRQKDALNTVYEYRTLPGDALVALVRRLVNEEETRYDRITGRNNMAAKVAPMLGLMGTLIPLGPGIQALGQADTAALSSSLLVAFDTTVAGLVTAAVCLVVGKIRSNWYENYLSALDASMATMLEKIEDGRASSPMTDQPQDSTGVDARVSHSDQLAFEQPMLAVAQPTHEQSAVEQLQPEPEQPMSEESQSTFEKLTLEQPQSTIEQPSTEQEQSALEQLPLEQSRSTVDQPIVEQPHPAVEEPATEQSQSTFEQSTISAQPVVEPLESSVEAFAQDEPQLDSDPKPAEPAQDEGQRRVLFGARSRQSSTGSSSDRN